MMMLFGRLVIYNKQNKKHSYLFPFYKGICQLVA